MADEPNSPSRPAPQLVALEYVTDDEGPMVELFCDHLGFEVVDRSPHPALDATITLIDAGPVMISILSRTADGDRPQIPPSASALTQLIFDVPDQPADGPEDSTASGYDLVLEHLVEAGAPVFADTDDTFHLGAQLTSSVFGIAPSLVFHRAR